jgi:hypothetical protein
MVSIEYSAKYLRSKTLAAFLSSLSDRQSKYTAYQAGATISSL